MAYEERYPYKIRVQFTAEQQARLKAATSGSASSITALIRTYVDQGLDRDHVQAPAATITGQLTIETGGTE